MTGYERTDSFDDGKNSIIESTMGLIREVPSAAERILTIQALQLNLEKERSALESQLSEEAIKARQAASEAVMDANVAAMLDPETPTNHHKVRRLQKIAGELSIFANVRILDNQVN